MAGRARRRRHADGCHTSTGGWGAGTGDVRALALATRRRSGRVDRRIRRARPRRRRGACRLARRPVHGARCCTTRRGRCSRWPRAAGRWRGLAARHGAVRLSRAPRPALLRPRRPHGALPQARAQAGHRPTRPSQLLVRRRRRRLQRPQTEAMLARARGRSTSPTPSTTRSSRRGGSRLLADVELPLIDLLAGWSSRGIAVDVDHLGVLERHFAAEVRDARPTRRSAVIGKEINLGSPKQLQVVLFDELGDAEDQAHQDRLHHRRRRAAGPVREDRAPVPHGTCCATETSSGCDRPIEGLLKTVQSDGRIHTTFNQMIAATGRLSVDRSQPAEHPDPHRGGSPDPRGLRGRRAGYDCLLTADYSQIEMRIMAHLSEDAGLIEAFRSGQDFHSITACTGVRRPGRRGDRRVSGRKIKAMNYGLAYGLSAFGLGQQLRIDPGEARGLMDEYFETVRRRARLPRTASSTRPAGPASPRRSSAVAATCPT